MMRRAVIITSYIEYPVDIRAMLQDGDHIVCLDGGYDIAMEQGIRPNLLIGDLDSLVADPESDPELINAVRQDADAAASRTDSAGTCAGSGGGAAPNVDSIDATPAVIGDMQIDAGSGARAPSLRILRYPPEKDYTDLELALRHLDPEEFSEVLIIGGIGGRLDQTAVNLQLIARYTAEPGEAGGFKLIEMVDGRNRCFVIHGDEAGCYTIPAPAAGAVPAAASTLTDPAAASNKPVAYLSLLPMTEVCDGVTLTGVRYPLDMATLYRGASLGISNEFTEDTAELSLMRGTLLVVCSKDTERNLK